MSFQKMYGFGGLGLSEVQLSISELSVVGGWVVVGGAQTHFMVGPSQGPTKSNKVNISQSYQVVGPIRKFNKSLKNAISCMLYV